MKTRWEKVYRGPFDREQARKLAQGLRDVANPEINMIHDATTRRRPNGGYDVFIKSTVV